MALSKVTRNALLKLAESVVRQGDTPDLRALLDAPHMVRTIPQQAKEWSDEGTPSLILGGDGYTNFQQALYRLGNESEVEHLSDKEIDSALWELCCELALQPEDFKKLSKRQECIDNFLVSTLRPHTTFEVIICVENLNIDEPVEVIGVHVRKWTYEDAQAWKVFTNDVTKDFANKSIAATKVKAGSRDKARERARRSIDDALDMIRFGLKGSLLIRSRDNENMFHRGELELVREDGGGLSHHWSWLRRPYTTVISKTRSEQTIEYLRPFQELLARPDLRQDMKDRLLLAMHWFGAATASFSYDEKVVNLCTAFEALFASSDDLRKGELISLRTMLMQGVATGGFTDTFPLLGLYVIRSYLVHGSERGLCGEPHYRLLHGNLLRMMEIYANYLLAHPEIRSLLILHVQ